MMCARFLRTNTATNCLSVSKALSINCLRLRILASLVLRHQHYLVHHSNAASVYMFAHVNKGFFPQQDTGRINGAIQGDKIFFAAMSQKMPSH